MNLNKILACGLMLGLLTAVSVAQRARLATGGTVPGARLPNAVHQPITHGNGDISRVTPNTVTTARPDATPSPTSNTKTKANTNRVSDRVITPDANDVSDRIAVGPIK